MFIQRKVGPLRPYLGGVQGLLFKCSVGDDSLRAEVGDVGVDVFDKRKCFVVWKLLIGVSVGKMRRDLSRYSSLVWTTTWFPLYASWMISKQFPESDRRADQRCGGRLRLNRAGMILASLLLIVCRKFSMGGGADQ